MNPGPICLAVTLVAQSAAAPAPKTVLTPKVYVTGAALMTIQPASGGTYHRVAENLKGHTLGLAAAVGTFLTPSLALEGEVVFGGLVSAPQRFSYNWTTDYTAENRDFLFNELLRWSPGARHNIQVVGGGGYARTIARQVSQVTRDFTGRETALPDLSTTLSSFTLTGGVDGVFPVGRRAAFVPAFRLRWINRPDVAAGGWNGVGYYTFQFGAGIRAGW